MGARAEIARRLTIESGSPMSHHSMSDWRFKQGSEGERKMRNRLTGGRKVQRAEERRYRSLREFQAGRWQRLEEALNLLSYPSWHDDDLLRYVDDATKRIGGMVDLKRNGGFEFSKTNRA